MDQKNIAFQVINWEDILQTKHSGDSGNAFWQTVQLGDLRLRIVEYTKGYIADHWCKKGHIVYCLEGSFVTEQDNGESFTLTEGMTYVVSDDLRNHRSSSEEGTKLLIIDGNFLKLKEEQ